MKDGFTSVGVSTLVSVYIRYVDVAACCSSYKSIVDVGRTLDVTINIVCVQLRGSTVITRVPYSVAVDSEGTEFQIQNTIAIGGRTTAELKSDVIVVGKTTRSDIDLRSRNNACSTHLDSSTISSVAESEDLASTCCQQVRGCYSPLGTRVRTEDSDVLVSVSTNEGNRTSDQSVDSTSCAVIDFLNTTWVNNDSTDVVSSCGVRIQSVYTTSTQVTNRINASSTEEVRNVQLILLTRGNQVEVISNILVTTQQLWERSVTDYTISSLIVDVVTLLIPQTFFVIKEVSVRTRQSATARFVRIWGTIILRSPDLSPLTVDITDVTVTTEIQVISSRPCQLSNRVASGRSTEGHDTSSSTASISRNTCYTVASECQLETDVSSTNERSVSGTRSSRLSEYRVGKVSGTRDGDVVGGVCQTLRIKNTLNNVGSVLVEGTFVTVQFVSVQFRTSTLVDADLTIVSNNETTLSLVTQSLLSNVLTELGDTIVTEDRTTCLECGGCQFICFLNVKRSVAEESGQRTLDSS